MEWGSTSRAVDGPGMRWMMTPTLGHVLIRVRVMFVLPCLSRSGCRMSSVSSGTLRFICGYLAVILRLHCGYLAGTLRLSCCYPAVALRLSCEYVAVILLLSCGYVAVILRLRCGYLVVTLRLSCGYLVVTLRLPCSKFRGSTSLRPCL